MPALTLMHKRKGRTCGGPALARCGFDTPVKGIMLIHAGATDTSRPNGTRQTHPQLSSLQSVGDQIANDIRIAARLDCPVLITGGRPDERVAVAKLVHQRERFVRINCRDMKESVLVGEPEHSKVMTLFLEGIEEMSERVQARLADYLAEQAVVRARRGARVIATAGRPLMNKIAARQFSEDLFYRLNLIHIDLDRRSDDLALTPDLGVGGSVQ